MKNISLEIRNDDDLAINSNNIGEVFIKGPAVASNYIKQKSHLKNEWLASGDLGFIHEENLYIVGRKKDLIIINGKNICANDVEIKASDHSLLKIGKIVAFSYTDKQHQEQVRLIAEVCETNTKSRLTIKNEICEYVKSILPLTPSNISLVPPLLIKKTTSGKIKRHYIKDMYIQGRVQKWENNFRLLFWRSQALILKLRISFLFKEKIAKILNKKNLLQSKGKRWYKKGYRQDEV